MSEWLTGILAELREEAKTRGFVEEVIGEVDAWPLVVLTREAKDAPTVYLSAGIHGDEPAPVEAILALLRGEVFDERCSWRICPVLNPTGLAVGTRENASGIDLNRDYLSPDSEEVRAHRAWLDSIPPPEMFLSLHEDWEATGFYYYEISLGDQLKCYEGIRDAAAGVLPIEPARVIDDHDTREPGWIYHAAKPDRMDAWPEAIYLAEQGCPRSYTLETPSIRPLDERVRCHCAVAEFLIGRLAGE